MPFSAILEVTYFSLDMMRRGSEEVDKGSEEEGEEEEKVGGGVVERKEVTEV